MARVAIVLVNWNGARFLPSCLNALAVQSWCEFRVVLVDNASSDGSVEVARRHFPELELVQNRSNLGFSRANNAGVDRALADPAVDYVLTLNNDTIAAPDFVERLVTAADRSPEDFGSWQGKVVFAEDPRILDAIGLELGWNSVPTQLGYRDIDVGQYKSASVYGVNAAAALYSRRFIEAVSIKGEFFDSDFFSYLEDVDVAVRGVGAGWRAGYVEDAVVRHVGSATFGRESRRTWGLTSQNILFLQLKNYSTKDALRSALPTLGAELKFVAGVLQTPQRSLLGAYFRGRLRACIKLRSMLTKRRTVLGRRVAETIFAAPRPPVSPAESGVRLSVVIPNWNGRHEIGPCLAALREQTVDGLEVIVVDNGSTDGSVEFIREQYSEVIVLQLPLNLGFAAGVNVGIKASNGEFVALLNNDALADPQWARELLAAMPHGDIAASLMLQHDNPDLLDSCGEFMSRWGLPYRHRHGESISGLAVDGYPEIFAASGGASIYRRAVFEDIGVFDGQYFAYLEDVDISFRARLAGYRIVLAPRARVLHKVGATAGQLGHFQLYELIKNSNLLVWKNLPAPLLPKVLPRFALIQAHLLVAAVRRGATTAALRAYAAIAITFPLILVKRHRAQRLRRTGSHEIEGWLTDHWPMNTKPSLRLIGELLRESRKIHRPSQ